MWLEICGLGTRGSNGKSNGYASGCVFIASFWYGLYPIRRIYPWGKEPIRGLRRSSPFQRGIVTPVSICCPKSPAVFLVLKTVMFLKNCQPDWPRSGISKFWFLFCCGGSAGISFRSNSWMGIQKYSRHFRMMSRWGSRIWPLQVMILLNNRDGSKGRQLSPLWNICWKWSWMILRWIRNFSPFGARKKNDDYGVRYGVDRILQIREACAAVMEEKDNQERLIRPRPDTLSGIFPGGADSGVFLLCRDGILQLWQYLCQFCLWHQSVRTGLLDWMATIMSIGYTAAQLSFCVALAFKKKKRCCGLDLWVASLVHYCFSLLVFPPEYYTGYCHYCIFLLQFFNACIYPAFRFYVQSNPLEKRGTYFGMRNSLSIVFRQEPDMQPVFGGQYSYQNGSQYLLPFRYALCFSWHFWFMPWTYGHCPESRKSCVMTVGQRPRSVTPFGRFHRFWRIEISPNTAFCDHWSRWVSTLPHLSLSLLKPYWS